MRRYGCTTGHRIAAASRKPAASRPSSRGLRPPQRATADGHRQGGGGDRAEVDRAQALQRQQQPDRERAPQRAPLPEAVQGQERQRQEDGDLRVQVREAHPAVRARREVGPGDECREPVSAHSAHEELRGQAREEEAAEKGDVVGEDGTEGALQRRDERGRQQQVLGEGQRVRQRVEGGGLEDARRVRPDRLSRPGEDPGVEAAVGTVHRPRVRQVAHQRPAHDREQEDVAENGDRDLGRGHGPGRRGAPRHLPGGHPRERRRRARPRRGRERRSAPTPTRAAADPGSVAESSRGARPAASSRGAGAGRARRGRGARGARPALRRGRSPSRPAAGRPRPRAPRGRRATPRHGRGLPPTARSDPRRARAARRPSAG